MKQIEGGVTAPKGFTAAGVHCGVKTNNTDKKDLAMILSEQECSAAAVYTRNPGEGRSAVYHHGASGEWHRMGRRCQLGQRQRLRSSEP